MVKLSTQSLSKILVISFFIRIIPILFLSLFENIQKGDFRITDIDYKVFSDSTKYQSPYERHTYRYTPILSYIMKFNYSHAEWIGKVVFSIFDVIAVYYLWKLIAKNSSNESQQPKQQQKIIQKADFIAKLYAYNPIFIYLTVRGSCQSITMALMYAFWFFYFGKNSSGNLIPAQIKNKNIEQFQPNFMHKIYAYLIYGLWVHYRIYPIIFLPLILVYQYRSCINQTKAKFLARFTSMGIFAGGIFIFLLLAFYSLYGQEFIDQTYLYHGLRKDNRHSFSPYFYDIYLNYFEAKPLRMLPAIFFFFFLISNFSKKYSIFYIQFLMTFGFVEFNTVITLQYYQWVWGALFLVLPESRIITWKKHRKGFNLAIQWILPVAIWIWMSLKVETEGQNILLAMWVICLVKILLDLWSLLGFMKTIKVQDQQQFKKIRLMHLSEAKELLLGKNKKEK